MPGSGAYADYILAPSTIVKTRAPLFFFRINPPAGVTLLKILFQDVEAQSRADLSHAICLGAFPFIRRKIFVAYPINTDYRFTLPC